MILVIATAMVLAVLPMFFVENAGSQLGVNMVSCFLQDGALFFLPCLLVFGAAKQPPAMLGFYKVRITRILIVGIACGLLFWLLNTVAAMGVNLLFPGKIAETQASSMILAMAENGFDVVLLVLYFCVVAPLAEEMAFRAFAYPPLLMRLGRGPAILITAILFGAAHLNLWTFFPLFIGGLGFGLLYDKFRNLWINACAHAAWNTLTVILYFLS